MFKARKICIVLTTRGNYAKMRSVIEYFSRDIRVELQLVVGKNLKTSRYGNYIDKIKEDGFFINDIVDYLQPKDDLYSMSLSAGILTSKLSKIFNNLKPDIVLVIADRYEALSVAHAATCMNCFIAHLEGGEVSGSIDERIRHSITKLSHIHFPSNKESAQRIMKMGESEDSIYICGSPSIDLIKDLDFGNFKETENVISKYSDKKFSLKNEYLVISQHPVVTESQDSSFQILQTLKSLKKFKVPIIWLLPNMDSGQKDIVKELQNFKNSQEIIAIPSLQMEHYAILLKNSLCLIGNSSSGIRECEYLGVPVVNIGSRQNNRLRGKNVIDVPYNYNKIMDAIEIQINNGHYKSELIYGNGSSGKIIFKALSECEMKLEKYITY